MPDDNYRECRQCGQKAKLCGCTFPDIAMIPRTRAAMNIFQQLHDSEINGRISSFYDRLWRAELGDEINGFVEFRIAETYAEAERALAEMAIRHYPDSQYAKASAIIEGEL